MENKISPLPKFFLARNNGEKCLNFKNFCDRKMLSFNLEIIKYLYDSLFVAYSQKTTMDY